ncbi:MAG: branched-chain amino acid ABC transporter substrate-binding protein [Alphaproteobacteria bacterium]
MLRKLAIAVVAAAAIGLPTAQRAAAADTIRLALIEPYSGPVAAIGRDFLQGMQLIADEINAAGGIAGKTLEIVPLDNAMKAEKTTEQVRKAIDDGIRFITQGVGSNHALNIIEQLEKHNSRNPDKTVLYLNHSAVTTAFTNEKCSFWHFRFDAHLDNKAAALLTAMGKDDEVKNVYMLNQNYAFGQSFKSAVNNMFAERVPNAKLVGDDLMVPFGKVQDFTPYVAKIKASNADTVLTSNWGPDIFRFIKAVVDAGLTPQFYTLYGGQAATIAGYGKDAGLAVRLKQLTEAHEGIKMTADAQAFSDKFRKETGKSWYADRTRWVLWLFKAAVEKAGSEDPAAVARALEGMTHPGAVGEVKVRTDDHQILMPLVLSEMTEDVTPENRFIYNGEDYGIGFKTITVVPQDQVTLPTTCKMKRPS